MEYVKLGSTDIEVSAVCLGCMGFGVATDFHPWTVSEEDSTRIIGRALELGINFFDTAMGYGGGTSEEFVGRALKKMTARENAVIATKFLPRTQEETESGVDGRAHVANCLNASLKRLGTDYVDLYICHMWDYHTPIEEIMQGLNDAVAAGKARAVGISNCYAWQLEKANAIAERNGWAKFVSMQGHYNLLFREEEREMLPCCRDGNITYTPYSPLASGRLVKPAGEVTKRLTTDAVAKSKYDATKDEDGVIIARVHEIAEKRGLTATQVSLGWLLTKGTVPIVGATKLSHVESAAQAVGVKLSDEETAYLEEPYVPHKLVGVMSFNRE